MRGRAQNRDEMSRRIAALATVLFLGILAAPALARAQTCWYTAAPDMPFGLYDATGPGPFDALGTFRFDCSNASIRARVTLSSGVGSFAQRQMAQGGARLAYNLYTDAARTTIFGDGTPPSVALTGVRRRTDIPVYGQITPGQWVDAGPYADTITITIEY